jgi:hypothetical protein
MSLRLLFIYLTWFVVTMSLVGMSWRCRDKSDVLFHWWILLMCSGFVFQICANHNQQKERRARKASRSVAAFAPLPDPTKDNSSNSGVRVIWEHDPEFSRYARLFSNETTGVPVRDVFIWNGKWKSMEQDPKGARP